MNVANQLTRCGEAGITAASAGAGPAILCLLAVYFLPLEYLLSGHFNQSIGGTIMPFGKNTCCADKGDVRPKQKGAGGQRGA